MEERFGFPTANIEISNSFKIVPAHGVYAVLVDYKGKNYKGMMDIGMRPTFNGIKPVIEVNIFNFDENIYYEYLTVSTLLKGLEEILNFPPLNN